MLVRKMTSADISAAVKIEEQCFSLPWSEKSFADSLEREDTVFLVCEDENNIVAGYIGMYLSFDEASITNVAVSPEFRKRGCGQRLVEMAKQVVKEIGVQVIFLEVRTSNQPAISLYSKNGFENLGIRKNFYEHPTEDAYIMSCNIE